MKLNANNNSGARASKGRYYGLAIKDSTTSTAEARRPPAETREEAGQKCTFGLGWRRSRFGRAANCGRTSRLAMRMNAAFIMDRARTVMNCGKPPVTLPDIASILVVDDYLNLLKMVGEVIRRAGHEVVEAYNGRMAEELAKRTSFDLVITDLSMPQKEGLETIIAFKQFHPKTKIIALFGDEAGVSAGNYQAIARSLGVSHTLAKPFTKDELMTAVSNALGLVG